MYRDGQGVPKDDAEAVKWFRLAAEQGLSTAQYSLAVMCVKGRGVPKTEAYRAVKWYRLAAEQGHAAAQLQFGLIHLDGKDMPKNFVTASMWLNLSAAQGNGEAKEILGMLAPDMTTQQIAEAQKLAREWNSMRNL